MALKHWIWLSTCDGIRQKTAFDLIERFGTPEKIYYAREKDLLETGIVTEHEAKLLCRKDMSKAQRIMRACEDCGCRVITLGDAEYPERLRNIYDPPVVLYVLGRLPAVDEEAAIAIVGTRRCTPYGLRTAERMGYEITRDGGLVISGLALGVDAAAAKGALRAGGRVIGVLGTSIDRVYPYENRSLFNDVETVGALVSEYAPGERAPHGSFPARNRIMSGLSVGVVVVEAPENSGALITASRALDQGRDLFAVPGNVDAETCAGSNGLLKECAAAVTDGWDVMSEYTERFPGKLRRAGADKCVPLDDREADKLVKNGMETAAKADLAPKKVVDNAKSVDYIDLSAERETLSGDEARIADVLAEGGMQVDDIIAASGLSAAEVLSTLTLLQIKGVVEQQSGKRFVLKAVVK